MTRFIFFAAILILTTSSCYYSNGHRKVRGSGRVSTTERNVTDFSAVETDGSIDLVVSKGPYKVTIKADEGLMKYITTEVINGRLLVKMKSNISFTDTDDITVYVSAPDINEFESHGSGNITGEGKMADGNKMKVKVFGSGDITLNLDCPEIESEIHGSGDVTLTGETRNFTCAIYASGDMKAADLKSETVKASVHASGDAEVFASESLNAEISGSGNVQYKGDPKISSTVHGSGEVSKMD